LFFSLTEYQRRLSGVREQMRLRELDHLVVFVPENLYYLTGYQTPGYYAFQCLLVPESGPPALVVRHLEVTNALALSWIASEDIVSIPDTEDPVVVTRRALEFRGMLSGRVGVELDAWFVGARLVRRLEDVVTRAGGRMLDASGCVEQVRLIKSPAEVDLMRRAARVAEAGVQAGVDALAVGATENEVAAEVHRAVILAGGEYMSLPPFVASGPRSALAHATWAGRRIGPGDPVFFEVSGCCQRYSSALMRTACLQPVPVEVQRRAEAVIEGLTRAIGAMRPGVPAAEVDRVCRQPIEAAGYGHLFRHRTGYSIGVNFPPDWGEGHIMSLKATEARCLEAGMVFHLVPAVLGDGWGIGFSETVLVTETGPEVLTRFRRQLLIV
jgi:Xaa-Pro dipeptidase